SGAIEYSVGNMTTPWSMAASSSVRRRSAYALRQSRLNVMETTATVNACDESNADPHPARLRRFGGRPLAEPLGARRSRVPARRPGRLAGAAPGRLAGHARPLRPRVRCAARAGGPQPRLRPRRPLGRAPGPFGEGPAAG